MNFFDHKDLGNHLLQLCPKVVKHPVYVTLRSSTCFEQHAAHHQEDHLYHHSLWYRHPSKQPYSMRVESGLQSALHPYTVWLLTEGDDTRGCGDTICPPEDEQRAARNMLRIVV